MSTFLKLKEFLKKVLTFTFSYGIISLGDSMGFFSDDEVEDLSILDVLFDDEKDIKDQDDYDDENFDDEPEDEDDYYYDDEK